MQIQGFLELGFSTAISYNVPPLGEVAAFLKFSCKYMKTST